MFHVSKNIDHIFKVELDYLTQSTTNSAKRSKGLAGLVARSSFVMCNEKRQTKYKPDFFATIFLITTSGQVSRARRLEAAHHYQYHVPSSGSQISNMDHLIIFFFFTDGNWIPRHERVHSAIPRGFLQFP